MGARAARKSVPLVKSPAPARKARPRKAAEKYAQSGAPWWKVYLPE